MKNILLIPLFLLASCLATQQAVTEAHLAAETALAAAEQASLMAANPEVTQAELDGAVAVAITKAKEAKDAALAVIEAVKTDAENAKAVAGGFLGGGAGLDGGAIGLLVTAASWWLRDRRKKAGMDPLQRADVATPPTTA